MAPCVCVSACINVVFLLHPLFLCHFPVTFFYVCECDLSFNQLLYFVTPCVCVSACINSLCPSPCLCHFPSPFSCTFCYVCECDIFCCNQLLCSLAPCVCIPAVNFVGPSPFCAIFLYLFAMFSPCRCRFCCSRVTCRVTVRLCPFNTPVPFRCLFQCH